MARGLSKDLEAEIHSQLGTLISAKPGTYIGIFLGTPMLEREATFTCATWERLRSCPHAGLID